MRKGSGNSYFETRGSGIDIASSGDVLFDDIAHGRCSCRGMRVPPFGTILEHRRPFKKVGRRA